MNPFDIGDEIIRNCELYKVIFIYPVVLKCDICINWHSGNQLFLFEYTVYDTFVSGIWIITSKVA